eukprot:TRINITY_DN609_c0_g1_i3.p1 TRINITY_DN609_c0_g1~~TRINITY_DN609_c0_g1_i3.p1  ORF type:complete len:139 (-),score=40.02 TRINITY_DN609_c0_g1_i3:73-489(-)
MSGVTVADSVVEKYNEIKMKKTLRFVTFKVENKKTIVPADEGDMSQTWDDFVAVLPEDEPRYCLVEIEYESEDGRPQNKLTFVFWSNDEKVSIKNKMLYASSKDAIKKKFQGIMKEVQANDLGDLDFDTVILQKMRAK